MPTKQKVIATFMHIYCVILVAPIGDDRGVGHAENFVQNFRNLIYAICN